MTRFYTNNLSVINLYNKPSRKSEVVTQMIFGDSFSVSKKTKNWLKVKIKEDGYKGFIQNRKFPNFLKPTHKIHVLKAKVYRAPSKKDKCNELTFGSKIKVTESKGKFLKFSKGWISRNVVKKNKFKEKNPFKRITIFKNIKYKWGGKSFKGIDCSALIQLFLNFNNRFCPRDAKDQVKYFKKKIKLSNINKYDIIYWKGHVALALTNKNLIHAYGPMRKTVIMDINRTIERIKKTANLKIIKIVRL